MIILIGQYCLEWRGGVGAVRS